MTITLKHTISSYSLIIREELTLLVSIVDYQLIHPDHSFPNKLAKKFNGKSNLSLTVTYN
jgi:hypothetical protein